MKRPQPDIGDKIRQDFINNVGSVRKWLRLWGTANVTETVLKGYITRGSGKDKYQEPIYEDVGTVEVLTPKKYVYPNKYRGANFDKFASFLGITKSLAKTDYDGIESAWMWLNKGKNSSLPEVRKVSPDTKLKDFVASNLNTMQVNAETVTNSIAIEVDKEDINFNPNDLPKTLDYIKNNFNTIWNNYRIIHVGQTELHLGLFSSGGIEVNKTKSLSTNDAWAATFARYTLSNLSSAQNVGLTVGYGKTLGGRYVNTYVVSFTQDRQAFTAGSLVVNEVVKDILSLHPNTTYKNNGNITKNSILGMDNSKSDIVYKYWDKELTLKPEYESLWIQSKGRWYLKADVLRHPQNYGLKHKQIYSYLCTLVDNDYEKESVPWWKSVLAGIVFIGALVLALPSGGASLTLTAVASAILTASLVIAIAALTFRALGDNDMATAFGELSKGVAPLTTVAGIVLLVGSLTQVIAEKGLQETATDYISQEIASITQGAADLATLTVSNQSVNLATKLFKAYNMYISYKNNKVVNELKDLQAEYEGLQQELSQENDSLAMFSRISASPATADWSKYAELYDLPYERGGGNLALGNIQRTTKRAMRVSS